MTRSERFLQRNRKVAQSRRGASDTVGNQSFNAYREDVGWKMSDDQYAGFKEDEAKFNTAVSGGYDAIKSSRAANAENVAKVNAQEKALSKLKGTSLDTEYETYRKDFKKVRVIDTRGEIASTHYLPKSVIDKMDAGINESGWGSWVDGGKNYNVSAKLKGGAGTYRRQYTDMFKEGEQSVKASFYKANSGAVKKANKQVADAKATGASQVATSRTNLANSENILAGEYNTLKSSEKTRADNIQTFSNDYSTALQGRRNLMKRG